MLLPQQQQQGMYGLPAAALNSGRPRTQVAVRALQLPD